MSSSGFRSVRFSISSLPETSPENMLPSATSPRSIASPSLLGENQFVLIPDTTDMTENDSLSVSPRQTYEYSNLYSHTGACESHQPSLGSPHAARGSVGHCVQPSQYTSSHSTASSHHRVVAPQLSKSMKAAQKTPWDVRFPPEATPYDSDPALQDSSMFSIMVACDQFPEDIAHIYGGDEGPITVADVYAALYSALLGEVTGESELYAQRTASGRADIQEVTARRLSDPSAKMRQWKGQLRDLLGNDCVLNRIIVDYKMGKWKLEFVEADD